MVNELVSKEIKINQVEGVNRILEGKIEFFKSKEDKNKEFLHEIFQKMDDFNSTLKELRRQKSELQLENLKLKQKILKTEDCLIEPMVDFKKEYMENKSELATSTFEVARSSLQSKLLPPSSKRFFPSRKLSF